MTENQSTAAFFSQGTDVINEPSSVINNISQVNPGFLYQHFDGEEVGMGNPLTNSSGMSFAETANNQLGDTNLITEQGVNPNTNIFANNLMSHEQQCFIPNNHVGSKHAVDQYCEANGLMLMPKPLSWLPPQEFNATTINLPLYPYHVFHEPKQQDVETQSPTRVHPWG